MSVRNDISFCWRDSQLNESAAIRRVEPLPNTEINMEKKDVNKGRYEFLRINFTNCWIKENNGGLHVWRCMRNEGCLPIFINWLDYLFLFKFRIYRACRCKDFWARLYFSVERSDITLACAKSWTLPHKKLLITLIAWLRN